MASDELYDRFVTVLMRMRSERYMPTDAVEGLSSSETRMLMIVYHLQNDVSEVRHDVLAEISRATPEAAAQQLGSLREKGLIERRHRSEDFRAVYVVLTDEGMRVARKAEDIRRARMEDMIGYIGTDDCEELIRILDKVSAYYEQLAVRGEATRMFKGADAGAADGPLGGRKDV